MASAAELDCMLSQITLEADQGPDTQQVEQTAGPGSVECLFFHQTPKIIAHGPRKARHRQATGSNEPRGGLVGTERSGRGQDGDRTAKYAIEGSALRLFDQ